MGNARLWLHRVGLMVALLLVVGSTASAARAEQLFVFFEEAAGRAIAGDATERAHANWIAAESFAWGATRPAAASATGNATSRPKLDEFQWVKRTDRASAALANGATSGRIYARVILEVCRQTSDAVRCYYRITLSNVLISSFQVTGNTTGAPTEEIRLSFASIRWENFTQSPDGKMAPAGSGGYDVRTGKIGMVGVGDQGSGIGGPLPGVRAVEKFEGMRIAIAPSLRLSLASSIRSSFSPDLFSPTPDPRPLAPTLQAT